MVIAVAWSLRLSPQTAVTWSFQIRLDSLASTLQRLTAPEADDPATPLTLTDLSDAMTRAVSSCHEYLDAGAAGLFDYGLYQRSLERRSHRGCYAVRDLGAAHAANVSYLPTCGATFVNSLPPILAMGEQYPSSALLPASTWISTNSTLTVSETDATTILLEDFSHAFGLHWLATADFNGDGVADIAVLGSAKAKSGTDGRFEYFLFTRCTSSGPMQLVMVEKPPFSIGTTRCH